MVYYIAKRLLSAVLIMWAVTTIVFFAMRLVPADPAEVVLGEYATPEAIEGFRRSMGLDQPILAQYKDFMSGLLHGDLGRSLITNQSVSEQIASLFPYTLELAIASLLVGALIGIPLGVVTAIKRDTWVDYFGRIFALSGFSFPAFYLGILLLLLFSLKLEWLPVVHSFDTYTLGERIENLILPAASLGIIQAAYITRLTRSSMLEQLEADYVRTARSKGLKERTIQYKHVLKNVMIPVITAMGLYTGTILGGAVLTEIIFSRPGIGKLLVGAITQRDYTLIQSGLLVFSFIIVLVNLIVDLSYSLFDPRVKYE